MSEVAFNKGIDYFTEIIFFYGVLFGISFYQIHKGVESSKKSKAKLKEIDSKAQRDSEEIEQILVEVDNATKLQSSNKNEIQSLEIKIAELEKQLTKKLESQKALNDI